MTYQRIEVDPEKWPAGYFQSSRHCPLCHIRWPNEGEWFDHCPKCEAPTESKSTKAPTVRWPDAVNSLLKANFDKFYEEWDSQEEEE